jgi:hypothetical protein
MQTQKLESHLCCGISDRTNEASATTYSEKPALGSLARNVSIIHLRWPPMWLSISVFQVALGNEDRLKTPMVLLRQYFPKSNEMPIYAQSQLDETANKLNTRPRKALGVRTSQDGFDEALQ